MLEFVVLGGPGLGNLCDGVSEITNQLKEGLITYSLAYFIEQKLDNPHVQLNPLHDSGDFQELLDTLCKCFCVSLMLKITELTKCFVVEISLMKVLCVTV